MRRNYEGYEDIGRFGAIASASTMFAYGVNLEAQSKASDDKMCLDLSRRRIGAGEKTPGSLRGEFC